MIIERRHYLDKLISKKDNGMVKVITGIRRCGKSFLLFNLYHSYLNSIGIADENIIELALDEAANARYRNPLELDAYIRTKVSDKSERFYVFLDEIQFVKDIQNPYLDDKEAKIGFIDVILGLMKLKNADLYVTGSNSHMLSSDILTEFRGRGDEIHVLPLSYREFYDAFDGDKRFAWREYLTYGGMPYVLNLKNHEDKSKYLRDLFENVYIKDVLERNRILNDRSILEDLLNIISSSVGSLTNPTKLSNTFQSIKHVQVNANTISRYLDCFIDAFILSKACRYDIKGKKYIETPLKYYFSDAGLRNARLNFRQQEETHIMENIIYNELLRREYSVDVGVVEIVEGSGGKRTKKQCEIDFVINKGSKKYYIQSALNVSEPSKLEAELRPLKHTKDFFKKIIIVKTSMKPWTDENGILHLGLYEFLLNENALEL